MLREKTGTTPGISQKTEKETETQKTNSIPFAKPIRRPMQLEGIHIAKEIKIGIYEPDNNSGKRILLIISCSHYGCDRYFAGSENDGRKPAKMNKRVCSTNFPVCASYLDNRLLRNHSTRYANSKHGKGNSHEYISTSHMRSLR